MLFEIFYHIWFIVEVVSSSDELPDVFDSEDYLIKSEANNVE
jgi:hypothetical protein